MITVAMLSHSPHLTGGERMLANLAISLSRRQDVRPVVLIPKPNEGPLGTHLSKHGVEWLECPSPEWYVLTPSSNAGRFFGSVKANVEALEESLLQLSADVVLLNTLTTFDGLAAAVRLRLPVVSWVHGILDAGIMGRHEPLARFCENLTLRVAEKVVVCSDWTRAHFVHRCPPDKVLRIHNWTTVPNDCEPSVGRSLVSLSTLDEHKGIDVLIEAINILKCRGVHAEVDLLGAGARQADLSRLAARIGVGDRVRFRGRTTDVEAAYRGSFALVVPSHVEPFGMVAIEAMAHGCPSIVSDTGGLREIIEDGVSGLRFAVGNAMALADKIELLMGDEALRAQIVAAGHERVARLFDGRQSVDDFMDVLKDVASKPVSSGSDVAAIFEAIDLLCGDVLSDQLDNTKDVIAELARELETVHRDCRSLVEFRDKAQADIIELGSELRKVHADCAILIKERAELQEKLAALAAPQ